MTDPPDTAPIELSSHPKRDWLGISSFTVALLALAVTTAFNFYSARDAAETLKIEREPVLVSECGFPVRKHPDYIRSIKSDDQNFQGLLPFPTYTASGGEAAEECVYSNLGRLPLINVSVTYSVEFLKTPSTSPVVPVTPVNVYSGQIKSIAAGASQSVWIANDDPCYDANVVDGQYASMTIPPDQFVKDYTLPGWLLDNFRLNVNANIAAYKRKHPGSANAFPDCP